MREVQQAKIPLDLKFYSTVIDALASQIKRCDKEHKSPNEEATDVFQSSSNMETLLANTCYRLLEDALRQLVFTKGEFGSKALISSSFADETRIMFHTAMKPACRLGDYERAQSLFQQMKNLPLRIDNVTMSCVVQAFCSAGKIADAQKQLLSFIDEGLRPNGVVASVVVNALSQRGRYVESWELFLLYITKLSLADFEAASTSFKLHNSGDIIILFSPFASPKINADIGTDTSVRINDVISAVAYSCSRGGLYEEAILLYKGTRQTLSAKCDDDCRRAVIKALKVAGKSELPLEHKALFL